MRKVLGLLVAGVFIATSACRQTDASKSTAAVQASVQNKESQPRRDDWQRMKECAEQADRYAVRVGWTDPAVLLGDSIDWQSHYSPKYERCYILVEHVIRAAAASVDRIMRFEELYDAFEGRVLSTCTEEVGHTQARVSCWSNDPASNHRTSDAQQDAPLDVVAMCRACREFIRDRMDK